MPGPRQHLKSHWHSIRRADQVQSPPIEAPLLGSALAEEVPPIWVGGVNLAASPGSHSFTHRHRHAVNDESLSLCEQLAQHFQDVLQPTGEGVQAAGEAGGTQGFGDVAHTLHHEQGSFMVVLEVHGAHHRHSQHFGIADEGMIVAFMPQLLHGFLDDTINRYNFDVVHVVVPPDGWFDNSILEDTTWTFNY
jgi:hypothetical protein